MPSQELPSFPESGTIPARSEPSTAAGPGAGEVDLPADPDARYTGIGRAHWEMLADRTLLAVRPYATPRHGLIDLPGPASVSGRWSDGLEGFARTFLLAGFRLATGGEDDRHNLAEWYASGLAAGVDPRSEERWPTFDEKLQAVVECASIALALHESRPYLWDRLDDSVRQRTIEWMSQVVGLRLWNNNWVWFQNLIEAFLRSTGGPWSAEDIALNVAKTDSWYAGDGWYSDGDLGGDHRNFDYYAGWAMQLYPLWYCRVSGADAEDGLRDRYAERLRRYLRDLQHFVAADGSPVFQGRSLTYRFAMVAPFWAGALFDASDLAPGLTRRLTSGVLRHFLGSEENGVLDQHGLQTIGWHHRFEPMRQRYSGPASPYWSSKGFAGLVLPADHPVWTAPEEPLPIEQRDVAVTIPAAGFVLSGTRADGIVRITNHRSDHAYPGRRPADGDDPVYARHAYSSHAAPDYGEIDVRSPLDSHVALVTEDGRSSRRRPFDLVSIADGAAVSRHRARWPLTRNRELLGPWLTTASVSRGALEVRLARMDPVRIEEGSGKDTAEGGTGQDADQLGSDRGGAHVRTDPQAALRGEDADIVIRSEGPWWLRFGGYPVAGAAAELPDGSAADDDHGPAATARRNDGLTSTVRLLAAQRSDADTDAEEVSGMAGVRTAEGANPFGTRSRTPWVRTIEPVEPGTIHAALIVLTGVGVDTTVAVRTDGDTAIVDWPDGSTSTVRLPAP